MTAFFVYIRFVISFRVCSALPETLGKHGYIAA